MYPLLHCNYFIFVEQLLRGLLLMSDKQFLIYDGFLIRIMNDIYIFYIFYIIYDHNSSRKALYIHVICIEQDKINCIIFLEFIFWFFF